MRFNRHGIEGYNDEVVQTFDIGTDGRGFLGIDPFRISWGSDGVVTVPGGTLADLSVGTIKMEDASITTEKIAGGAVTTVKLGDASVSTAKIGNGQITTAKIGDAQVTTAKIPNLAVTTAKIGDAQVSTAKMANGSVTSLKIGDFEVTTDKFANGSITTVKIGDNQITAPKILAGAIIADKIASNAVVAAKIAAGAVVADKIATDAVTASKILAGAVTAAKINVTDLQAVAVNTGSLTVNGTITVSAGNVTFRGSTARFEPTGGGTAGFVFVASSRLMLQSPFSAGIRTVGNVEPESNNVFSLGVSGLDWTNVWVRRIRSGLSFQEVRCGDLIPTSSGSFLCGNNSNPWSAVHSFAFTEHTPAKFDRDCCEILSELTYAPMNRKVMVPEELKGVNERTGEREGMELGRVALACMEAINAHGDRLRALEQKMMGS